MGDGLLESSPSQVFFRKTFEEWFPFYLSIGMSVREYWDEDVNLAKAFKTADKIKKRRENEKAWLQGLYVYDAMCRVSPLFHAFRDKETEPVPYREHPFSLLKEEVEAERAEMEQKNRQKAAASFGAWAAQHNARVRAKNGDTSS